MVLWLFVVCVRGERYGNVKIQILYPRTTLFRSDLDIMIMTGITTDLITIDAF
jgi:hypothetical protein